MPEWIRKLFSEPATLGIIITSAVVGLIGGSSAGAAQFKHGGWSGVLRCAAIGMAVAVVVGLGVSNYVTSETAKLAIVGACAAIGEDIWEGLKAVGKGLRTDPLGYLARIIDALRGRNPRNDQ